MSDVGDGAGENEATDDAVDDAADGPPDDAAAAADSDTAPDPAAVVDELDGPVILFDGVCNLCNGFVRFVVRFDDAGTFQFAPLQSPVGQELLERHDLATEEFDSMVLAEDGEISRKSTAALKIARRLDGPLPLAYPFVYLPERLRNVFYDLVAANRYRIFGKKEACPMPEPEVRERFAERSLD